MDIPPLGRGYRQQRIGKPAAVALDFAQNNLRKLEPHQIKTEIGKLQQDDGYATDSMRRSAPVKSTHYTEP